MRNDRKAAVACMHGDALGLRQSADPANIGLDNIDGLGVHELKEFEARVLPFAERDLSRATHGRAWHSLRRRRTAAASRRSKCPRPQKISMARSASFQSRQAYATSTMRVMSGPTALRMSRTMRAQWRSSSICSELCEFGPFRQISSLAARKAQLLRRKCPLLQDRGHRCRDRRLSGSSEGIRRDDLVGRAAHQLPARLVLDLAHEVHSAPCRARRWREMRGRGRPVIAERCRVSPTGPPRLAGLFPISVSRRPRPMICVPGASLIALATHGLVSVSPIPT